MKEEAKTKTNGCGCQTGILRWFRPPYAKAFRAACECHDDEYNKGGDIRDRHLADRMLFQRMMKRTWQVEYRPLRMWWMCSVALCYYGAVRLFGRFYFNFGKSV